MIDIALDEDGCAYTDESQELVFLSGHEETIQAVKTLWESFLGEWWLDLKYGIDWLNKFLDKATFDVSIAARELREKTRLVEGVASAYNFIIEQSENLEITSIKAVIKTIYNQEGEVVEVSNGLD